MYYDINKIDSDKKFNFQIGGITMVKEIEEKLQEYYDFLTIEVEHDKIKTYKIFISVKLADFRDSEVIKGEEFYYNWKDHLTFTANIEQIKYDIEKAIIKFFRKENKEK